ncbi:MAG TPA: hypothetical protein PKK00_05420 [Bacteroidales bacterium]|nr:hypothetical protein [Bacteroidales bacterium]HPS17582.1 hypothetical protein [Bacteroidales bacterium]
MTKKILISFFTVTIALFVAILFYSTKSVIAYTDGNPPGCTGSPADGQHCATNCHNDKSIIKVEEGWITSTIPQTGYIPDSTYTITCTAKGEATSTKFGFEASPQFPTGKTAGKMSVINTTETKLVGGIKYITQIKGGVDGQGSRSWSFKWKAPIKGSGPLTFYAAFIIGGKPETAVTSKLEIKEAQ